MQTRDCDFDSSDDRKLSCPSWEWKPVLFGNQKGNHGREAGRARHGDWNVRECTYAELPTAFLILPDSFSARVGKKEAFFNFKQKAANP